MNEKFETLKTVSEYMVNLLGGINKAVEYFQAGEDRKGYDLIPLIADGIQWISEALTVTKDIHKQDFNLQNINEKLIEIVEAMENGDYILIGDLFQYELTPILEDIQSNINKVIAS